MVGSWHLEELGSSPDVRRILLVLAGRRADADAAAFRERRWQELTDGDRGPLTAHSLRAGHITEAATGGARRDQIRNVSRHSDERMVAHYTRSVDSGDSSSAYLGLHLGAEVGGT